MKRHIQIFPSLQVIVKGIHGVGQAIYVEDFVVHRPIQTVGDVHLVKVLFHMVVRKEGVQGPLAALQNCRSCFLSHGTYKTQRVWSSATQLCLLFAGVIFSHQGSFPMMKSRK